MVRGVNEDRDLADAFGSVRRKIARDRDGHLAWALRVIRRILDSTEAWVRVPSSENGIAAHV